MRERENYFKTRIMFSHLKLIYVTDNSAVINIKRKRRNEPLFSKHNNIATFACSLAAATAVLFVTISIISSSQFGALALASSPLANIYTNKHQQIISPSQLNEGREEDHLISSSASVSSSNNNHHHHNHHNSRRRRYYNSYATTTPTQHINIAANQRQNQIFTNEIHPEHEQIKQGDIADLSVDDIMNNEANFIGRQQKLTKRKRFEDDPISNQQVPEQLPIVVVSSSDNSYASASPVFSNEETTTISSSINNHSQISNKTSVHNNNNMHYEKPSVNANYHVKTATIIKTRESIDLGAIFINYTIVTNLEACLVECWITDSCDTAIYQESPVDFNNHLPYFTPQLREEHDSLSSLQLQTNHKRNSILYKRSPTMTESGEKDQYNVDDYNIKNNDDTDDDDDNENDDDTSSDYSNGQDENIDDNDEGDDDDVDIDNNIYSNEIIKSSNSKKQQAIKRSRKNQKIAKAFETKENNNNEILESYNLGFFICYLFQCAKSDGFKCQFSAHNYYVSSVKKEALDPPEKLPNKSKLPIGFIKTLRPTISDEDDSSASKKNNLHYTIDESGDNVLLNRGFIPHNEDYNHRIVAKTHYSKIVRDHNQPSINGKRWHDTHVANIRIGQEDYEDYARGGWNSALIAIMFGIGAIAMIIMVVGHKMNSIEKRIAIKGRRRSLVPDTDFFINPKPSM